MGEETSGMTASDATSLSELRTGEVSMRWFFYYLNVLKPIGGLKQIRLMASLLRELGVETYLLRDGPVPVAADLDDSRLYDIPVAEAPFAFEQGGELLRPDDVLVLPEVMAAALHDRCRTWKCRIALNNQNGFYALRFRPPQRGAARMFEFALANAQYVASISKDFLGIPPERIFLVPHWVVRSPFELTECKTSRVRTICYMPRKLPDQLRQVRELVQATHPTIPWIEIDGLPAVEVARKFRENSLFFATQDQEGCPLPALEAMTCGCLVAGFPGTASFPHPYATSRNGFWASDRNVRGAAAAVNSAINVLLAGGKAYEDYLEAGRQTAQRFSQEAVRQALQEMLSVVEGQRYATRKHAVQSLDWRGRFSAYRLLYEHDQLGWPGRMVSWLSNMTKPLRKLVQRRARPHAAERVRTTPFVAERQVELATPGGK
jgi:hypothetical protein